MVSDGNPAFMAFSGNGGQLVIASSYPQSSHAYSDIAVNGSNNREISSSGRPFTALEDDGQTITITGGTGFTPGTYTIQYVDGSGNAFLNNPIGSTSATGGTGTLNVAAGGYLYCDSGSGPVIQRFSLMYTDLVIDGSNSHIVTSAAQPFTEETDAGFTLKITGGTGFTPGTLTILSVDDSTGKATLSGSAGSTGSTGGQATELFGYVPAVNVQYLDTFFIVQASYESRLFYVSAPDDGTNWDATQVASKESYPDNINSILTDHEELWLFGSEESIEGWHNAGTAPFPFVRDDNAAMHYGIEGLWTVARFQSGFCWLGMDQRRGGPIAFYAQGFQPVRISNYAMESIWSQYSTVKDAIAYSYIENGHHFYVVNFATANATWVYDGFTQMWHQRAWFTGSYTTTTGANGQPLVLPNLARQRQAFHAYVDLGSGGKHYVGDWQNGNVYIQSAETYTDDGVTIFSIRIAPHISDEQTLNYYHRLQLDLQTGGAAMPNILLDWSDDGGHTFGNYNVTPSLGSPGSGQYAYRVIWTPLGSSRDRVYKVTLSDPVKRAIVGVYLDNTAGLV